MDMEAKIVGGKQESVAERLERHAELKARMERLLDVVENAAELRAIEELRQMGLEMEQGWGRKASSKGALEMEAKGEVVRHVQKLHWMCTFGEITVDEQTYLSKVGGELCRAMVQTGTTAGDGPKDRRKTRKSFWKEDKLPMIRRPDEINPVFAVTLGDAAAAAADLMRLTIAVGFDQRSRVHGGDGAP